MSLYSAFQYDFWYTFSSKKLSSFIIYLVWSLRQLVICYCQAWHSNICMTFVKNTFYADARHQANDVIYDDFPILKPRSLIYWPEYRNEIFIHRNDLTLDHIRQDLKYQSTLTKLISL